MLRLAELSLRNGDFEVHKARNGVAALQAIRECKPDLVIMDVQMPEMDGLQALNALKTDPETASIPVVMLTGRGHHITRQEAEKVGACAFLTKPFSPTQLLAEVQRILGE